MLTAALCRLGAVQIPVLPIYRGREIAFVLAQTEAAHLLVAPRWRDIDLAAVARLRLQGVGRAAHCARRRIARGRSGAAARAARA